MVVITHQNVEGIMRKNKEGEINVSQNRISVFWVSYLCVGGLFFLPSKQEDGWARSKHNSSELAASQSSWSFCRQVCWQM